jgi:hypothetical protein
VDVMRFIGYGVTVVTVSLGAACGGSQPAPATTEKIVPQVAGEMSPEEAGGMRPEDSTMKEAEAPKTPHGGTAVQLGAVAQLEFVHDPSSGLLTAYVLDAGGRDVMRIPAKTITLEVTPPGGTATPLVLNSTANGLTGDTVGNSSQFGGTLASLKGVTSFTGSVKDAAFGSEKFSGVAFTYPAAH